jgi:hypothetical protein
MDFTENFCIYYSLKKLLDSRVSWHSNQGCEVGGRPEEEEGAGSEEEEGG